MAKYLNWKLIVVSWLSLWNIGPLQRYTQLALARRWIWCCPIYWCGDEYDCWNWHSKISWLFAHFGDQFDWKWPSRDYYYDDSQWQICIARSHHCSLTLVTIISVWLITIGNICGKWMKLGDYLLTLVTSFIGNDHPPMMILKILKKLHRKFALPDILTVLTHFGDKFDPVPTGGSWRFDFNQSVNNLAIYKYRSATINSAI